MTTAKWVRDFVRRAGPHVGLGDHRIVFLVGGPGSTVIDIGKTYLNRKAACREAARAQTRSNLSKISYVFERYKTGRGAVWISADTLLWEGVMPKAVDQ